MGRGAGVALPFLLLGLLLAPAAALTAQAAADRVDGTGGGWTFTVGLARQGTSDGLISPLRYAGSGLLLGAGYSATDAAGGWWTRASYTGPRTTSRLENERGGFEDTHQAELGGGWLGRVAELYDDRIRLYLGAAVDARASVRFHHYGTLRWGGQTENFGDAFLPFQAAGMWTVPVGSGGLLAHRIAVPVATVTLRSPYSGLKYLPEATVAGPTVATGIESELSYRHAIFGRRAVALFHRFSLLEYPDPMPLTWVVHRLGVRLEMGR